jgi:hypothetical protein
MELFLELYLKPFCFHFFFIELWVITCAPQLSYLDLHAYEASLL